MRLTTATLIGMCLGLLELSGCRSGPSSIPPLTISKDTTYITEPLLPDGTPDYVGWLNRKCGAGVTTDDNAAPQLVAIEPDALRALGLDPKAPPHPIELLGGIGNTAPLEEALKKRGDATGRAPGMGPLPRDFRGAFAAQQARALEAPWSPSEAPVIAEWIRLNEGSLAGILEVTRTRTRYFVPITGSLAFDAKIPSRLSFRHVANAFRARALESLRNGDVASARRDLVGVLRLAALLEQGPFLIDRLIGIALRGAAAEPVVVLANPPASVEAARELVKELREAPAAAPIVDALDVNERLIFLAGYVDLYRAGRTSSQAWEQRITSLLGMQKEMAEALREPLPSSVWKEIPAWAIDWGELLRTLNRCWESPDCDTEKQTKDDLSPLRLRALLVEARVHGGARIRIARAFAGFQSHSSLRRAQVSWNEAAALVHIGLVSATAGAARAEKGRYPADSAAMASAGIDPRAGKEGYAFSYKAPADGSRFSYGAMPEKFGVTGVRAFCADSTGTLTFTSDGKQPALPDGRCDPTAKVLAARTLQSARP
jgi:hypothetical protein